MFVISYLQPWRNAHKVIVLVKCTPLQINLEIPGLAGRLEYYLINIVARYPMLLLIIWSFTDLYGVKYNIYIEKVEESITGGEKSSSKYVLISFSKDFLDVFVNTQTIMIANERYNTCRTVSFYLEYLA